MKRCSACLIPDTFPGTVIGSDGSCNRCAEFQPITYRGADALRQELSVRPGATYDCIVPISGGKDSTYALYLAREKLGLRPLAVHYDNRFTSPLALENIRRVCDRLGVEFRDLGSRSAPERKFVTHFLKAMVPLGISWGICTFCFYGLASVVYATAVKERVPSILWAIAPYEIQLFFPRYPWDQIRYFDVDFNLQDHFDLEFPHFITRPLKRNATPGKLLNAAWHLNMALWYVLRQRVEMYVPPFSNFFKLKPALKSQTIREFLIYQYFEWNDRVIEETLERELGWEKPTDREIAFRYDCVLAPFNDIRWRNAYDMSLKGLYCSCLMRADLMTREDGEKVVRESQDDEIYRRRFKDILDELGVPDTHLRALLDRTWPPGSR